VSQVEKLILSSVLTLTEFGYFSLAILVATSINSFSGPISQSVLPRMTFLLSNGDKNEMLRLYRDSSELVTLVAMSLALMIAFYAEPLIYAWTGDKEAAYSIKKVLFWYALGNGVLAILAFQYYLQVAHGKLNLHVKGATLSALIDVPIMIYVALNYGALGAGISWFILRIGWLVIWTPIVHHYYAPGIHLNWLRNILLIVLALICWILFMEKFINISTLKNRWLLLITLLAMGLSMLLVGSLASTCLRKKIITMLKTKYANTQK
jgi:O-antigen/teichoic acid export membrane protein